MSLEFVLYVAESSWALIGLINAYDGEVRERAELELEAFLDEGSADVDEEVNAAVGQGVAVNAMVADVLCKDGPSEALERCDGGDGRFFPLSDNDGGLLGAAKGGEES